MHPDRIVLLHGLAMPSASLSILELYLRYRGYETFNIDYPSRRYKVETLVKEFIAPKIMDLCNDSRKVHIVTHSLGGIITRTLLKEYSILGLGRVVMLAPPNKGSHVADWLSQYRIMRWWFGPALSELTTHPNSFVNQLGPVNFDLGIIMGDRSLNPFSHWILPSPNDGLVSVENSKVEGMKDFLVKHTSHSTIVLNISVFRQIVHFLEQGYFKTI